MPLFGKSKKPEDDQKKSSTSSTTVQQFVHQNGNSVATITQTRTITSSSTVQYRQERSVSVSGLGHSLERNLNNMTSGISSLSLQNNRNEDRFKLPALPAPKSPALTYSTSSNPQIAYDAKPFQANNTSSKINLNYESPYKRSSPAYKSFQGTTSYPTTKVSVTPAKFTPSKPLVDVKPLSKSEVSPKTSNAIPTYELNLKRAGEVLIINNIIFRKDQKSERQGAQFDGKKLNEVFKKLNFGITSKTNLDKADMQRAVKNFSKQSSLKDANVSVVVIMSHGTNHQRVGGYTEIFGVDDQGCPTDELIQYFTAENCPQMRDKPKIFIFQCCRGNNTEFIQTDAKPIPPKIGYADMLIAFSTLPGFVSHRDPRNGTWYIQTLCEVFAEHASHHHVEDMLKIVDSKLSQYGTTSRQVTTYENRGFKRCYLRTK